MFIISYVNCGDLIKAQLKETEILVENYFRISSGEPPAQRMTTTSTWSR